MWYIDFCRKMITSTNPEVTISQDNQQWTVKFKVLIKTNTVVFKLGEEFTETNPLTDTPQKVGRLLCWWSYRVLSSRT